MLTPFGNKQRIKGIEISGIDFKLSQYPDDTTLILDGSEESFLESVILIIETFGNISGLRLNIKKKEALWIDSKKDSDLKRLPEKDLKCPKKKAKSAWGLALNGPHYNNILKLQRKNLKN